MVTGSLNTNFTYSLKGLILGDVAVHSTKLYLEIVRKAYLPEMKQSYTISIN